MINPTSRNINIVSLIVSVIFCSILYWGNSFFLENKKMDLKVDFNSEENLAATSYEINENLIDTNNETKEENKEQNKEQNANWILTIPEINLQAEIAQGTSTEIMNQFIGHFEETKIEYGNIGLAAHNRGYPVNYFQDLKKLHEGSEIIYKHGDFEMTYIVDTMEIIENTNWDYLKNTEDNRITLITCVENEPKYRRCIQGVEKIESEEY